MIEDVCGRNALNYFGLSSNLVVDGQTSKNSVTRSV